MNHSNRRSFLRSTAWVAAFPLIESAREAAGAVEPVGAAAPARPTLFVPHDLHTHTTWSDGAHSLPLHILEARAYELEVVAVTDHYTPGSRLESDAEFDAYLAEIDRCRSGQDDVMVVQGAEATALDAAGRISIGPGPAERLEWVLCDLGGKSEGTLRGTPSDKRKYIENVMRTYLGLCDIEYLDVIAHPFNTGNTRPAALPADYPEPLLRELASKMAAKGKVFDVMNNMIYWFHKVGIPPRELTAQYVELIRLFAAEKVLFQVSSDDHRTGLGNTRWSHLVIERAGVPKGQIVDARRIGRK